jgi:hypothetical protein
MVVCFKCGEEFSKDRYALGFKTCLICGELDARLVRHCSVPLNKSNYIYVSGNASDVLKQLNPKKTT